NSNILRTKIESEEGSYLITDFAPRFEQYERYFKPLILIRKVEPVSAHPKTRVTCNPTSHYATQKLSKHRSTNNILFEGSQIKMGWVTNMPISHFVDERS